MSSSPVNQRDRCEGMPDSLANLENLTPPAAVAQSGSKVMDLEEPSPLDDAKKASKDTPELAATPTSTAAPKQKKTYVVMAHEAIASLKDRSGSSQIAIAKYILSEYPHLESPHFKSRLGLALKQAVKTGRFVKVRASFKINTEWTKKERSKKRAKEALRKKKDKQRKEAQAVARKQEKELERQREKERQQKALEEAMTDEEREALQKKIRLQEEAEQKKLEAEKLKKEIAERIRKRRFPMEDELLHKEDKELGVKAPADVKRRPALPYFFTSTIPFDKRGGKTPSSIISASRCDALEYGSRGLVSDLMQVYHFFRGDVGYQSDKLVPDFTMKNLIYAMDEILNGNAKKSRMVPPLISHLFVTVLRLILRNEGKLSRDFAKLEAGLGPASWSEVCFQYMDAMERYYTSDASLENVLPGEAVDIQYLMRATDEFTEPQEQQLPAGYCAYLGDPRSALARAHAKLETKDAWNLTAEEIAALLRALTDDVLGSRDEISEDIANRDEEMHELLKAKKSADSQYRKIRLAYEGPKHKARARTSNASEKSDKPDGEKAEQEEDRKSLDGDADGDNDSKREGDEDDDKAAPKFKPTATKKQFEAAKKAQIKANDAYDKGLRKLVSRREPVGYDRNYNAVYFFNHDPDMLYVETFKPPASSNVNIPTELQMKRTNWHVIETKSLFDQFVQSLDIRGTRENELYESLMGPPGGSYSMRRFMFDDIKERSEKVAMKKELEELNRRLANARIACAAEEEEGGRRSGRLASRAQIELSEVQNEIEVLEKKIEADAAPKSLDYYALTGMEALWKFDNVGRRETRRTREKKEAAESRNQPAMPCSTLWSSGNIDGTGIVGSVVSKMLELEEWCESLAPYEGRNAWIANLEDIVHAWNSSSPTFLGPPSKNENHVEKESDSVEMSPGTPDVGSKRSATDTPGGSSEEKRRRLDSPASSTGVASQSVPQILASLKPLLLDLERRVLEITGLGMANRDAELADDNMSVASNEDEDNDSDEGRERMAWKKKVHSLISTPTSRYGQIREILVEAIAAARKAHLSGVVAELRSALLLHHPNAAGECKAAAIAALERHGGYEDDDDDSGDESDGEEDQKEEAEEENVSSILSGEAMMINGSLDGDENANRVDWIDAVNGCKTVSRLAALAFAFLRKSSELLKKNESEEQALYDALAIWEKEEQKRTRGGKASTKKSAPSTETPTEVWANVRFTEELCMAKVEKFPAWPAKRCVAKDPKLADSLNSVSRVLVSLVGEEGRLRVVKMEDISRYTGKPTEGDEGEYSKDMRAELDDCLAMARRIVRGNEKNQGYAEEKKVSSN